MGRRRSTGALVLSCAVGASLFIAAAAPDASRAVAQQSSCVITQDRSIGSTTPATIEFVNQTGGTVTIHWLAFDGTRRFWFNLAAGRSQVQGSYIGHAWLVTDSAGTCVGYVISDQAQKRYVIAGTGPPPAPGSSPSVGTSTFTDPAGDSSNGPDVTTLAVSNDAAGQISFRFAFANRPPLRTDDDAVNLCFDTDRNAGTGLQLPRLCPNGAEYVLYVIWPSGSIFNRWNGSRMEPAARPTLRITGGGNSMTISINRSDLGGASALNFQASTEPIPGDTAPNSGSWGYVLGTTPPTTPTAPAAPAAPRGRTMTGTRKGDVLKGTSSADKLYGKGGNDRLYGYGGDDLLHGGPGADRLFCGAGRDTAIADRKDKVARDCEVVRGIPKRAPKPSTPRGSKRLQTSVGTLAITAVQLGDRFPPGCALGSPICDRAVAGYQVLVVWLARTDGGNPGALSGALDAASKGSYVVGSDGSRGERAAGGLLSGRLFVAYTPRASARGFKLYWSGNQPIALGK